ncbi:MAG TPA: extracellular solute-binding protein [Clostridiales bacterium]|nr:extracellular solute-binding protein [Clostridiales bacterium]
MKKWKVKPFTLFLIVISLLFLIFFPIWMKYHKKNPPADAFDMKLPEWSGIIELWDIPSVQAGKDSHTRWLRNCINSFEQKHPGVFINLRSMDAERLAMYLHGTVNRDILPDIISLGIYNQPVPEELLTDLSCWFEQTELSILRQPALKRVMSDDRLIAVPWAMGCYALYVNCDAVLPMEQDPMPEKMNYHLMDSIAKENSGQRQSGKKVIDYYGFCTYNNTNSKPLLGMIYQEGGKISNSAAGRLFQEWLNSEMKIFPPDLAFMSYSSAFRLFALEKRAAMLLGDSKAVFDMRKLQESGKGLEYRIYPLPLDEESTFYMEQIAAYGLLTQNNKEKERLCIQFLKELLQEESQRKLADIGLFSVLKGIQLYIEDEEMKMLEDSLEHTAIMPYGMHEQAAQSIRDTIFPAE